VDTHNRDGADDLFGWVEVLHGHLVDGVAGKTKHDDQADDLHDPHAEEGGA
jgi:hypothetical protein